MIAIRTIHRVVGEVVSVVSAVEKLPAEDPDGQGAGVAPAATLRVDEDVEIIATVQSGQL